MTLRWWQVLDFVFKKHFKNFTNNNKNGRLWCLGIATEVVPREYSMYKFVESSFEMWKSRVLILI